MLGGGKYCIFLILLAATNSLNKTRKRFPQVPQKFDFWKEVFLFMYTWTSSWHELIQMKGKNDFVNGCC